MKSSKIYLLALAIISLSLSISSCSGDDGAVGPQGETGLQGDQGLVGPAGADGSVIYSNEGEPAEEVGAKGDYYFDISTGLLYGPKLDDTTWADAASFMLKGENGSDGEDGTDGQDGSKILSGKGAPTGTDGEIGDYYLDIETYTLYGPKTKLSRLQWGMGLVLKGVKGNANVKTFSLTVPAESWSVLQNTSAYEFKRLSFSASFSALNKDIMDNGFVLVYWKNGTSQYQLPYVSYTTKQNLLSRNFSLVSSGSGYKLDLTNILEARTDKSELLTVTNFNYKVVIVSGEAGEELQAAQKDPHAFQELSRELGIE
ncbi:hypothetical protein [Carboxylicivirga sp. N1Y90]|uniref:hypothetical protein n=1 Tax=Carboxylicivirga fragile TaxID=3417571 RepID=UPI003D337F4B|nr:collagen-like protein [Marinilabiliaceae bacterium N1Y90]